MLIECTARRPGGTKVDFDRTDQWPAGSYHFAPSDKHGGAHVAEVTDKKHLARFLSIHGYQPFDGSAPAEPVAPPLSGVAGVPTQKAETEEPEANEEAGSNDEAKTVNVEDLAAANAPDVAAALPALSAEDLGKLLDLEQAKDKKRPNLVKKIKAALEAVTKDD